MKPLIIALCALITLSACGQQKQVLYDLAIRNVDLFDSQQRTVLKAKTILINADTIAGMVDASDEIKAQRVIDGNGRLAVPGFIDTHVHLSHVLGDAYNDLDALGDIHRQIMRDTYLPYGTTTVVEMGQPPKWIRSSIEWEQQPDPDYPNIYISGGALISDLDRPTPFTHEEVVNPEEAREKVREYAEIGIKRVKLYSYLDEPEFSAVVREAQRQNMIISGHIDRGGVTIPEAMALGVKNFEHILSLATNVIHFRDQMGMLNRKYDLAGIETIDEWVAVMIFYFELIDEDPEFRARMNSLLDEMAKNQASLSTTIHQMGAVAGETYFFSSFGDDDQQVLSLPNYTDTHKRKLKQAFQVLMKTLRNAHDKGVRLRIGTDCRRGGEAILSEFLLLYEHGFSVEEILQIATFNGATAMGLDQYYGQIAVGKKADIVIFERSPFLDYQHFLSNKLVIKGGRELNQ
ncbi:amidohydrolase family protein [Flavilitoribacter nigricans]|uniref:Amidohydrolase-related domain-containing protein n=1 Tax=Flavilitoribacter nigricans (strain ATCC 23147 / DSM 23189 / NBRC 102662 / NCIMB 1420 / SS-2) TaxID=1122177 RepID=A0A2D0N1Y3_FLAN2|nr:amidohydrolase family protein [Flavilitoribacter nigricans]PHN02524.1 hypothetical protein CRP01_31605 [Flavilitoribacter nigricans DSM 23189 = NBRC 102662]